MKARMKNTEEEYAVDVSVILPVYNADKWLDECLQSIFNQKFDGIVEISVYNDGSTDQSTKILQKWSEKLDKFKWKFIINGHESNPNGVGFAKNRAIEQSRGKFLCFLDADDYMEPNRILNQWQAALDHPNAIIGCQFNRIPETATPRYTNWANTLSHQQLYTQIYLSHGPTLIMPTWFCSREVFNNVGGFNEDGKGTPEDLIFFYRHLDLDGKLHRVDRVLLSYRYHEEATTFSINEEVIWKLRFNYFEKKVLSKWNSFTIWNAGKQGRKFYRCLSTENRKKVISFCDLDTKKINKGVYVYELSEDSIIPRVPIIHFKDAKPPIVICVKLGMTNGQFENNLNSLGLEEGMDYFHFN